MAFDNFGQGYFTFDQCDFTGALEQICDEIDKLQNHQQDLLISFNFAQYVETLEELNTKIEKRMKVMLYIAKLKVGQKYV